MLFYRRSFCSSPAAARQQASASVWRAPCRLSHSLQLEWQQSQHLDAAALPISAPSSPTSPGRVQNWCLHEHSAAASGVNGISQGSLQPADGKQEQLHRPMQHESKITPSKLAGMSQLLGMGVEDVQKVLDRHPQLAKLQPHQLGQRLQAWQTELQLNRYQVRLMVVVHGDMLASVPAQQIRAQAQALAQHLKVPVEQVLTACRHIPSIIMRRPQEVARQLQRIGNVLGIRQAGGMLRLAMKAPQLLTATPGCVQKRLQRMSSTLRAQPAKVLKGVHQQPDLLFLSPRILYHKVEMLQCIFDRQLRLVVPIVLACPKLLRTNPDAIRASFTVLQAITGRDSGYSFGMVCHAPHLLLEHPQLLLCQAGFIQHCAKRCDSWQAQLRKFSPAQLADCLALTAPTYARLIHLLDRVHQADEVTLIDALSMPRGHFVERFPGTDVEQYLRERHRRGMVMKPVPQWAPPAWPDDNTKAAAMAAVAGPAGTWAAQSDKLRALRRQRSIAGTQIMIRKYQLAGWLPGLGLVAKQMPAGAAGVAAAQARARGVAHQARIALALADQADAAGSESLEQAGPTVHDLLHPAAAFTLAAYHEGHVRPHAAAASPGFGLDRPSQHDAWHAHHNGYAAAATHASSMQEQQQQHGQELLIGLRHNGQGQGHNGHMQQDTTAHATQGLLIGSSYGTNGGSAAGPQHQARTRRRAARQASQPATEAPLQHGTPQQQSLPDSNALTGHSHQQAVDADHNNSPQELWLLHAQQSQQQPSQQRGSQQQAVGMATHNTHCVTPVKEQQAVGLQHGYWQRQDRDQPSEEVVHDAGELSQPQQLTTTYHGLLVPAHTVAQEALAGMGVVAPQHVGFSNGSSHVHTAHVERGWSNVHESIAQPSNGWAHAEPATPQQQQQQQTGHAGSLQHRPLRPQPGAVKRRQLVHAAAGKSSSDTDALARSSELHDSNDLAMIVV